MNLCINESKIFGSYLQSEDEASRMGSDGSDDDEGFDWEDED